MNRFIKSALVRYLQPTIDELVQARIQKEEEEITSLSESAVESAIDSAWISHSVELEIEDQMRQYNFEGDIERAVADCDIDKIVEEKVEEAVDEKIPDFEHSMKLQIKDLLSRIEILDQFGKVIPTRCRIKREDEEVLAADDVRDRERDR